MYTIACDFRLSIRLWWLNFFRKSLILRMTFNSYFRSNKEAIPRVSMVVQYFVNRKNACFEYFYLCFFFFGKSSFISQRVQHRTLHIHVGYIQSKENVKCRLSFVKCASIRNRRLKSVYPTGGVQNIAKQQHFSPHSLTFCTRFKPYLVASLNIIFLLAYRFGVAKV